MSHVERFEQKFIPEPNSGCWIWLGALDGGGYGRFAFRQRNARASRVAWELFRGDIADSLHVLHRCDNRLCVNPGHLWLGTNQDNCIDKAVKGRHQNAKICPADVIRIRSLKAAGSSYRNLARAYGIDHSTIRACCKRETWAHVA